MKKFSLALIMMLSLLTGCATQSSAPSSSSSQASSQTSSVTQSSSTSSQSSTTSSQSSSDASNAQSTPTNLASLNYSGSQEVVVNNDQPSFTADDLKPGAPWQTYSDLDSLNRAGAANALLNQSMMPTAKRTALTWNPTGWHNKRIKSGWLYNRSHLIGYQLSGQNNNPKNLMTGTRALNAPEMLAHENDIAYYLKQSASHFVRYRVTPIFRGDELLARGVQMEAQSIDSPQIKFNRYIFNVQDGVQLNYADGTSRVTQ